MTAMYIFLYFNSFREVFQIRRNKLACHLSAHCSGVAWDVLNSHFNPRHWCMKVVLYKEIKIKESLQLFVVLAINTVLYSDWK
jgi:hypothetical protein